MPPKSNIDFSSCTLYFQGIDEPVEISGGIAEYEPEYVEDHEPYIINTTEPVEITLDNVPFPRDWVLVECCECGYEFPITEFHTLIHGTEGWRCPRCVFNKILRDTRRSDSK